MFGLPSKNDEMIRRQLIPRGIRDERVIDAFQKTDRKYFVPGHLKDLAYNDSPLSIGEGQTISQPFIVALMTQALMVNPGDRVLEIGTGSGYQTAILSRLAGEVCTIERYPHLSENAQKIIGDLRINNVKFLVGDGFLGWPDEAPFDRVIITAAPPMVPEKPFSQLKERGIMIVPVGEQGQVQTLCRITRTGDDAHMEYIESVAFVPMISGTVSQHHPNPEGDPPRG